MSREQEQASAGQMPSNASKESIIAVASVDARQLLNEGRKHQQSGRLSAAVVCYRRVFAINPEHSDALCSLGVVAHQMGPLSRRQLSTPSLKLRRSMASRL
jgi:Flp pilus assembly protein TadD